MTTHARKQRIQTVVAQRQEGIVVLEDIYDPHNAAAVFRTCEAFGVQKVFLIFEKQKKFDPKKIGKTTSSSANKWLDFTVYFSTEKCFKDLKKMGYATYGTVLDASAKSLFNSNLVKQRKIALVFGNEHSGLSDKAITLCDKKIYIPMQGFVQSLNLSVTAGIVLSELFRQRQEAGFAKFLLPTLERTKINRKWK
jgi:tRNA (guanosine-2'-O-)-methyltransferase